MAKIKLKGFYEVLRGLNGMGIADKDLFDNLSSMGEINVSRYGISPTQYTLTSDPLKNKAVTVANIREVDSMSKVFNGSRFGVHPDPLDYPAVNYQYLMIGHGHDFYNYGESIPGGQDPGQTVNAVSRSYYGYIGEYDAPGYSRITAKRKGKKIIDIKSNYSAGDLLFIARNGGGLSWHKDRLSDFKDTDLNTILWDDLGVFGNSDTVIGGKKSDFLYGGDGQDKLDGKKGDDILYGGNGSDIMKGGKGQDLFVIDNSSRDVITDYGKSDLIELESALSNYSVNIKTESVEVVHNLTGMQVVEITDYAKMPNFVIPSTADDIIDEYVSFGSEKLMDGNIYKALPTDV